MSTPDPIPQARPKDELDRFLRRVRRRWLAGQLLRNLSIDLIACASLLALLLGVDRTVFPGFVTWAFAGIWTASWLAASVMRTLLWGRLDRNGAAVLADRRLALKERVSSVEHLRSRDRPELQEVCGLIEGDAARAIHGVPVAEKFPITLPRFTAWILIPAAACAALAVWLPVFDLLGYGGRKQAHAREEKVVEEQNKKLDDKLKELAKKAEEKQLPDAQKVLELLAQKLEPNPANVEKKEGSEAQEAQKANAELRKDALVQMSRREDAIKKGLEDQKFEPLKEGLKALQNIDLKKAEITKKLQEALKNGDFQKAKDALSDLKADLNKLSQKKPEDLTADEKARLDKLSEELSKLAKDSKALAKLSRSLNQGSQSLGKQGMSSKDFKDGLESLENAAQELDALSSLSDEMDMLDEALEVVQRSKEKLAKLQSCPECGTPYCPDCGKPQCGCKPSQKPGGT